jgi:hypothetical protein
LVLREPDAATSLRAFSASSIRTFEFLGLQGMRESVFSIVNYRLHHPEKYPAGGPQVYRDLLKKNFLTVERALHKGTKVGLPVK